MTAILFALAFIAILLFFIKKLSNGNNQEKTVKRNTSNTSIKKSIDFKSPWLDVINNRVKIMPLNSKGNELVERLYGRTGMGVKELGIMHFGEYVTNQSKIPEYKRKDVALNRLNGFRSIEEHINSYGTKEQKFHLDASIVGAEMFTESIGIYLKNYRDELQSPILAKMEIDQRFAIFFVLINIANSDGITDEEHDVLAYAIDELDIIASDYNESTIDGNQVCDLLQNLNDEQKKRISELIAIVVGADSKFSSQEMIWVNDIIMQIGLDDKLMVDLAEKYSK